MPRSRGKKHASPKSPHSSSHSSRSSPWEKPGAEAAPAPQGFEFRDRSGKLHRIAGGRGPRPGSTAPAGTPKSAPKPPAHPREEVAQIGRPRGPKQRPHRHGRDRRHSEFELRTPEVERPKNPKNYGPSAPPLRFRGSVDKNKKGFGFINFDNRRLEDAFVPPREAEHLFHGDRVEVAVSREGEILDLKVVEHRFREIVGRYYPNVRAQGGHIVYERKNVREEIWVSGKSHAKEGDWVKASLEFEEGSKPEARILEVYGPELPSTADIGMVSAEFNLVEEHSAESIRQAESYTLDAEAEIKKGRMDLRDLPLITIDGETARDFDDAVYVERKGSHYILWVGIADVSHYVTEDSPLDKEARSRGTSVYFPERAFHMLPRALSENLCSLVPNQPRLCMVAKIEIDHSGKQLKVEVMEGVMHSKRRATYSEIQAEWEANRNNSNWEYRPHFELYQILRKHRTKRGSLDFELPEAELRVDAGGMPISIKERPRLDAHRLIEEFMIAANEAVTHWMMEREWPFVYRVHDEPSEVALARFQRLAANLGVPVSFETGSLHLVLPEWIERLEGHPAQGMLNMALLRSMKRAMYSAEFGRHFGLASPGYTHFTSPIRRYPDLVVHRLIRHALWIEQGKEPALTESDREKIQKTLDEITEHCSYRERIASDAERESIRLKQIRIMLPHLGDEFDGVVNGMNDNGLFIKLNDPFVEGFIPKDSMTDDQYEFNEERMIFYGRRKKRTFKIGAPVRIRVDRADMDQRIMDFALVGAGDAPEPRRPDPRSRHARNQREEKKSRRKPGHQEKPADRKQRRKRRF
jgi:ribonuclease R